MADQTSILTPEELQRSIHHIERELSRLDVKLADCYAERSRLIREYASCVLNSAIQKRQLHRSLNPCWGD